MNKLPELKKTFTPPVLAFLAIAFLPAWVLFLLPLSFGKPGSNSYQAAAIISWALAMWMPGIATLIVTRFVEKKKLATLNLKKLGKKGIYFWAWVVPILMALITGALTWAFRLGVFDSEFSIIKDSLAQLPEDVPLSPLMLLGVQI